MRIRMTDEDQAIWFKLMDRGIEYPAFPEDGVDRQKFADWQLMLSLERAKRQHRIDMRSAQLTGRYYTGRREVTFAAS